MEFRELENELQREFPRFRRIWVQYSRHSKKKSEYTILITLFPADNGIYTIISQNKVRNIDSNSMRKIINEHLDN